MNQERIRINHAVPEDLPGEVLSAFIILRDLHDSQEKFDKELFYLVECAIEQLPLFEIPELEELHELTDCFQIIKKNGSRLEIKI